MADHQGRVVAALNFLTGEGIDYHPDGCDQETLMLINDYFSAPKSNEESGSSDSEGLALIFDSLNHKTTLWLADETLLAKQSSTSLNGSLVDTGNPWIQHVHVMNTFNFNIDANNSMNIHECNNGGIYTLNVMNNTI